VDDVDLDEGAVHVVEGGGILSLELRHEVRERGFALSPPAAVPVNGRPLTAPVVRCGRKAAKSGPLLGRNYPRFVVF
jgi:hypothetical protein